MRPSPLSHSVCHVVRFLAGFDGQTLTLLARSSLADFPWGLKRGEIRIYDRFSRISLQIHAYLAVVRWVGSHISAKERRIAADRGEIWWPNSAKPIRDLHKSASDLKQSQRRARKFESRVLAELRCAYHVSKRLYVSPCLFCLRYQMGAWGAPTSVELCKDGRGPIESYIIIS